MISVTVLIDKLTEIERSLGIECDVVIRNQLIDAQDCALRVQADIAEMLRPVQRQDATQDRSGVSAEPELPMSGWRRAVANILPLAATSTHWRR
jgi:hypothetical protein